MVVLRINNSRAPAIYHYWHEEFKNYVRNVASVPCIFSGANQVKTIAVIKTIGGEGRRNEKKPPKT